MDLAPHALHGAAPVAPVAPAIAAPALTSIPDLDSALAALADRAVAFARTPPREKAALLRATLPRLLAAAPDMAAALCRARGLDPRSPAAAGAWLTGPIAAITHARALAESLEDIVAAGRPALDAREIHKRKGGRTIAHLAPRTWAERAAQRGRETYVLFHEGVEPEDVIAGQAAFYRKNEPEGGVALASAADGGLLDALFALFVEGHVALLALPSRAADLAPIVERALAPLVDPGFLRVAVTGDEARAHLVAHAAIRLRLDEPQAPASPLIVVPCLYAKDELAFLAQSIASQRAHGAGPGLLVLPAGWLQRTLFVELLEHALGAPNAIDMESIGSDANDPAEMVAAATTFCNERLAGAIAAQIVLHPIHEDDPEIVAAVERAMIALRCGALGINQWPALARYRTAAPWGAGTDFRGNAAMVARIDKTVVEGPLRSVRKPMYFLDNRHALRVAERLASFAAAPRAGDLWTVAGR